MNTGIIKTKIGLWCNGYFLTCLWKGKEIESLSREELYELIIFLGKNQKIELCNGEFCPTCGADIPPNKLKKTC